MLSKILHDTLKKWTREARRRTAAAFQRLRAEKEMKPIKKKASQRIEDSQTNKNKRKPVFFFFFLKGFMGGGFSS